MQLDIAIQVNTRESRHSINSTGCISSTPSQLQLYAQCTIEKLRLIRFYMAGTKFSELIILLCHFFRSFLLLFCIVIYAISCKWISKLSNLLLLLLCCVLLFYRFLSLWMYRFSLFISFSSVHRQIQTINCLLFEIWCILMGLYGI